LIKPGPSALVVAAVIGNPPQKVNDQLQLTLEDIHSLYHDELNDFSGDNEVFENSGNLLQGCLLSEQKDSDAENKKKPWFAWFFVLLLTIFIGAQTITNWQDRQLADKLAELDLQPGIIVKHLKVIDSDAIELNILRDPDAVLISDWLKDNNLAIEHVALTEHQYYSLAPEITRLRMQKLLSNYPEITAVQKNDVLFISGTIGLLKMQELVNTLTINGYNQGVNLNTQSLKLTTSNALTQSKEAKNRLFKQIVGRISTIQLDFPSASDQLTLSMKIELQQLYHYVNQLNQLADEIGISFGLVIMGCSDNTGSKEDNERLSINRATNTSGFLTELGLSKELMYETGLGQIGIDSVNATSRKVLFNVIHVSQVDTAATVQ